MLKKAFVGILAATLLAPGVSFADPWGRSRGYGRGYRHPSRVVVVKRYRDYDGATLAVGILGGIATGIILDRILIASPPPQPVYSPPPPPPPPRDPYDRGYSEGYEYGVQRGRQERYEQGRRRGYEEGYEDARAGKIY